MKRLVWVLVILLAGAVAPASASPIFFTAALSGPNESPPNSSPGTGTALVTLDPIARTMEVQVTWSGLLVAATVAHIHVINGPGDANTLDTLGPVATTVPTFPGFPGTEFGSYHATFDLTQASSYSPGFFNDAGMTAAAAEAALVAGIADGRAYLNIHTSVFPGGEIRGFLEPFPVPVPVPEPSGLALLGLAAVAAICRRRRHV